MTSKKNPQRLQQFCYQQAPLKMEGVLRILEILDVCETIHFFRVEIAVPYNEGGVPIIIL